MGLFNGMFPILAGKEEAARAFAAETIGARKDDFNAQQARANITRETWAMQDTPMGSFMLVWFEGDVEKAFGNLASGLARRDGRGGALPRLREKRHRKEAEHGAAGW